MMILHWKHGLKGERERERGERESVCVCVCNTNQKYLYHLAESPQVAFEHLMLVGAPPKLLILLKHWRFAHLSVLLLKI